MEETAMTAEAKRELEMALRSGRSLEDIVGLLRRYKDQGAAQEDVYAFLETLHHSAPDEATDDRILEAADFVAGFCAPHMRIWQGPLNSMRR
jgi:hypothetical protein